jgi:hypothetical protein
MSPSVRTIAASESSKGLAADLGSPEAHRMRAFLVEGLPEFRPCFRALEIAIGREVDSHHGPIPLMACAISTLADRGALRYRVLARSLSENADSAMTWCTRPSPTEYDPAIRAFREGYLTMEQRQSRNSV